MKKIIPIIAILNLAPGPIGDPLRFVRDGILAFRQNDFVLAEKQFRLAAELIDDPGLIAFNRAAIHAERMEWREAEQDYFRCLADQECPAGRKLSALYNRGICLLKRDGKANIYRVAIDCFESVLEMKPEDNAFHADVQHNLELAKLLWQQARLRETKPPPANDLPPEEERRFDPPMLPPPLGSDPGGTESGPSEMRMQSTAVPGGQAAAGTPNPTDQKAPGGGTIAPLPDQDQLTKRTAEDTRTYLLKAAIRLDGERRSNAEMLAGPERKSVRDW